MKDRDIIKYAFGVAEWNFYIIRGIDPIYVREGQEMVLTEVLDASCPLGWAMRGAPDVFPLGYMPIGMNKYYFFPREKIIALELVSGAPKEYKETYLFPPISTL